MKETYTFREFADYCVTQPEERAADLIGGLLCAAAFGGPKSHLRSEIIGDVVHMIRHLQMKHPTEVRREKVK